MKQSAQSRQRAWQPDDARPDADFASIRQHRANFALRGDLENTMRAAMTSIDAGSQDRQSA